MRKTWACRWAWGIAFLAGCALAEQHQSSLPASDQLTASSETANAASVASAEASAAQLERSASAPDKNAATAANARAASVQLTDAAQTLALAKEDLDAQKQMADAAKWQLFVGCFAAGISIIGTVLLLRTLIHTREAAEAATASAKTAHRQLIQSGRAWLDVEITPGSMTFTKTNVLAYFHLKLKNIGQTPALFAFPVAEVHQTSARHVFGSPDVDWVGQCVAKNIQHATSGRGTTIFPGNEFTPVQLGITIVLPPDFDSAVHPLYLHVVYGATYWIVGDDAVHQTIYTREMRRTGWTDADVQTIDPNRDPNVLYADGGDLRPNQVRLNQFLAERAHLD